MDEKQEPLSLPSLSAQVKDYFDATAEGMETSKVFSGEHASPAWHAYLATTLQHLTEARRIFMDDVKQFVTLVLVLFAGAGVLASSADRFAGTEKEELILYVSALVLLFLVFPVVNSIGAKAEAAYELYIAAAIHGALVHKAVGLEGSHQWFSYVERVIGEIKDSDIPKEIFLRDSIESLEEFEEIVKSHWKTAILNRWKESGTIRKRYRGNLLKSFNTMIVWAKLTAGLAMIACATFAFFHLDGMRYFEDNKTDASAAISQDVQEGSADAAKEADKAPPKSEAPSTENESHE